MKYINYSVLNINKITLIFLNNYTSYLQNGKMSPASVYIYMTNFKASINKIRAKYNNLEIGVVVIPYNLFERYKMPPLPISKKRALPSELIKAIANIPDDPYYNDPPRSLINFIRDMFMLSFYTRGTNTITNYAFLNIVLMTQSSCICEERGNKIWVGKFDESKKEQVDEWYCKV